MDNNHGLVSLGSGLSWEDLSSPEAQSIVPSGCIVNFQPLSSVSKDVVRRVSGSKLPLINKNRIREFLAGREAAQQAIITLSGLPKECEIGRCGAGAPVWPSDYVGSISHKLGIAGAIVGFSSEYGGLGLDIELAEKLSRNVWSTFAVSDELEVDGVSSRHIDEVANILFSMKEALYKCIQPLLKAGTPVLSETKLKLTASQNIYVSEFAVLDISFRIKAFVGSSFIISVAWANC